MDAQPAACLDGLYRDGREHDAPSADRLLRLRNMTPQAAGSVSLLIWMQQSGHVREIGTSNGYSAVWFADALRDTGGRLTSVEIQRERAEAAEDNLRRAGVSPYATALHADGGEVLSGLPDASVGLVVLDAERSACVSYLPELRRVLTRGGGVAVDSAVGHGEQLVGFRVPWEEDPDFTVHLQQVGDGVLTAVRAP